MSAFHATSRCRERPEVADFRLSRCNIVVQCSELVQKAANGKNRPEADVRLARRDDGRHLHSGHWVSGRGDILNVIWTGLYWLTATIDGLAVHLRERVRRKGAREQEWDFSEWVAWPFSRGLYGHLRTAGPRRAL